MNKSKLSIPDDVLAYSKKQMFFRRTKSALWILFVIFTLAYYAEDFCEAIGVWTVLIYIGVFALSFAFIDYKKFFDETWMGEIIDIKTDVVVKMKGGRYVYQYDEVILKIKLSDKEIAYKAYSKDVRCGAEFTAFLNQYKPGVNVVHVRGTNYLQIVNDKLPRTICVICGTDNERDTDTCRMCKHSFKLTEETVDNF